jgi:hypothetical protein
MAPKESSITSFIWACRLLRILLDRGHQWVFRRGPVNNPRPLGSATAKRIRIRLIGFKNLRSILKRSAADADIHLAGTYYVFASIPVAQH